MCDRLTVLRMGMATAAGIALSIAVGCGGSGTKSDEDSRSASASGTVHQEVDPGAADPSVPAELGGTGFEKVAAELGYVTHEYTGEELRLLGDPRAKKGGKLTTWVSRFPNTLRMVGQHSNYRENSIMSGLVYEGLVDTHPVTREFIPVLASHWKISDDHSTYWFRIDPEARWSDGTPVTADDVVVSWKLRMDDGILFPSTQLTFGKFEEPVAESKYIVRVSSKVLNWRNFLYFGTSAVMPAHKLRELAAANGVAIDSVGKFYLSEYQFRMLPGTGPYYMREEDIEKQLSYALTRRDDWWAKDRPEKRHIYNFDKIKWVVVKDNERLPFEQLKRGDIDFYVVTRAQWWAEECDFDGIRNGYVQKRKIYTENPVGITGFALNMRIPPFDNHDVRRAFRHLLNRERMIEELFFNQYQPMHSYYAGSVYENPNNKKYSHDQERGIELLRKAGYERKNSDGILLGPDGRPFQVEMGITTTDERVITPFQQELRQVGIDLRLKYQDGNALWKMLMERKFKLYYANFTGLSFPNPETSMHSSLADQNDTNNIFGIKNPRIDELCRLYDHEFDQTRRVQIIREIDSLAVEEDALVMGWYAPYRRILYWNKFGQPEFYLGRFSDQESVYTYWWFDPDLDAELRRRQEQKEPMAVGAVDVTYWPEYLKRERERALAAR